LINITRYLLNKLLQKQAEDFEQNGGFSERMMQIRLKKRKKRITVRQNGYLKIRFYNVRGVCRVRQEGAL